MCRSAHVSTPAARASSGHTQDAASTRRPHPEPTSTKVSGSRRPAGRARARSTRAPKKARSNCGWWGAWNQPLCVYVWVSVPPSHAAAHLAVRQMPVVRLSTERGAPHHALSQLCAPAYHHPVRVRVDVRGREQIACALEPLRQRQHALSANRREDEVPAPARSGFRRPRAPFVTMPTARAVARQKHTPRLNHSVRGQGRGVGSKPERGASETHYMTTHTSSRGLAVGGIATSLRVPPVVHSGALGVGVASRGRSSERPATRAGWSPAAGD